MQWNWQHPDWPSFTYDQSALTDLEADFLKQSGVVVGALRHITSKDKDDFIIDLISTEAIKTSAIEGEFLNRDSVQASLRRNFGLDTTAKRATPAEQGIALMMTALYQTYDEPLSDKMLFDWHGMLTRGRTDLNDIGRYRTHSEPMQIVSGADYAPKIHFEAPPSSSVALEMERFIDWFNTSKSMSPLTRASIAHLYFESIHPFEDGNGRIGRAIAEKALSQNLGQPTLLALSYAIESKKKAYYGNLERSNKTLHLQDWIAYFANTILEAQSYSLRLIEFLIAKTKLYDRLRKHLNERQEKAIARMFREGPEGFKGGLSADNYMAITGATRPTTTRDLADLVEKGALIKTGERRYTRYWLNVMNSTEVM
ncbi:toxin-antitoxin system, toxin component, Fic family [Roseibium sp. TrichSKD4]|uniref:Fic family protein n=1 Tax=Roseibium sp. TrichSKD4 TaxID=744980 RepID=UPI0001E5699D|nr:Fic family protein [Roseibium sp. TrichSKD4]EFO30632.1 toxin-antitoxin system, toxin component, Fic family [Roseibium sp. TrichSKD4]